MNKYQNSLNYLSDNCNIKERHCYETYCAEEYVHSGEEETKILQELIDKQNKYRWHDLRKDADDLPKENGYVMAMFKGESKPCVIYCLNGEFGEHVDFVHFELEGNPVETYFEFYDPDVDEVLAWKYIEEFE